MYKIHKMTYIWQFKQEALAIVQQAGHLNHHLQCQTTEVAMRELLKMAWRNQAMKSGETKTTSSLQSHHSSKHPHNSLCSSSSSLPVRINVLKQFDAKPLSQLPNRHGSTVRIRVMFLSFFKRALLPNFSRSWCVGILIMILEHSTISSTSHERICALGLVGPRNKRGKRGTR
jgi:hypothetical protein